MCRTLANFLTTNGYSAISAAGITVPSGRMNCLCDGSPVRWHGSSFVPTPDVAALSATVDGITPLAMPSFNSASSTPIMYSLQADRAFGTDSCHDVFFLCFFCLYFTKLGLLFLNRTLLGGMESLRSESGISAFGISI